MRLVERRAVESHGAESPGSADARGGVDVAPRVSAPRGRRRSRAVGRRAKVRRVLQVVVPTRGSS